jgi:hypothetical protein
MILDPVRNELRSFLDEAGERLELIRFTGESEREDALKVIDEVELRLLSG